MSGTVSSIRYRLRWPREVHAEQLTAAAQVLSAAAGLPTVLESRGQDGRVGHYLTLPRPRAGMVTRQLHAAVPGIGLVEDGNAQSKSFELVLDLALTTARRSLVPGDPAIVCRAVLTALAAARGAEVVALYWRLVSHLNAGAVPNKVSPGHESWFKALVTAPLGPPPPLDADARGALKAKRSVPSWRAIGRIAVTAETDARRRSLAEHVLGALRTAEAPGVHVKARRFTRSLNRGRAGVVLNVLEMPALAGWPMSSTLSLPVERSRARTRRASKVIPTNGRVIGEEIGSGRAVALNPSDSLRHLHLLGPTGVGKSTLMLNLIVRDLEDGRGAVVIEPKGDLIADVLARVPEQRIADVVLLDPTDHQAVVGLNPLAAVGRSPELVADQLLAVFHGLYAASWGPRTQDILHSSLLTLAGRTGSTLVELPLLLTDAVFRRGVVGRLDEPVALQPFWAGFEAWTEAQRTEAIAPVMNKVRPFLLRANLRAVLGQSEPRFDVRQVFTERKILLVNLAKGAMGSEAAALLGSLVVSQLWQATLERSRVEPARRHPVFVHIDEFQDYLHLPTDLADALAAARGLGVGLTLAHQHLHQLRPEMRSAVLANARSRVCFQLAAEDARLIAAGSPDVDTEDLMELDAFEIYAQLVAAGAVQPWLSARTLPAPPPTADLATVVRHNRELYGRDRRDVDAELAALRRTNGSPTDIGIKRSPGGAA